MSENAVDQGKRRFLLTATSVVGGIGVVGVVVPFLASMAPSQRAKAAGAPVEVDISRVEPGMMLTAEWRGKPIWVVNRTKAMMDRLPKNAPLLADPQSDNSKQPDSCKNEARSVKEHANFLVAVGVCTHLGCSPTFRKEVAPADLGPEWPGGFFCPCHGSKFDMAARVFKGVPAPLNLEVPPYKYLSDTRLLIGEESKGA
jgi:ubiquinol-cytochrome c reductase iron-sulfur subunit